LTVRQFGTIPVSGITLMEYLEPISDADNTGGITISYRDPTIESIAARNECGDDCGGRERQLKT
jgi:hypothetical protein